MLTPKKGVVARGTLFGVSVLVCAGCATMSPSPRWEGTPTDTEISVEVTNLVWNDITIYSAINSSKTRLGFVTTGTTGRFKIPRHHSHSSGLELIADPVESRVVLKSGRINVGPGQAIRWTVHENAGISSLTIW